MNVSSIARACAGVLIACGAMAAEAQGVDTAGNGSTPSGTVSALSSATDGNTLNTAQQTEAQARMALAKAAIARLEGNAGTQKLGSGWKVDAMNMLLAMPSRQIKTVSSDTSWSDLAGMRTAAKTARATDERTNAKLLGSQSSDLVYYPITPCRNADTRNAIGPIAGGTARQYNADNAAAQGGTAGCGVVPLTDASAWAMNITVINMNTQGFVAVRSVGSTSLTSIANYTGPGQQINNFVIVFNNRASGTNEWEVYAATTVDVIIDLFGYFLPPFATALDCSTVQNSATVPIGGGFTLVQSTCGAGTTLTGGGCNTPSLGVGEIVSTNPFGATVWNCAFQQIGSAYTGTSYARCCTTPGR